MNASGLALDRFCRGPRGLTAVGTIGLLGLCCSSSELSPRGLTGRIQSCFASVLRSSFQSYALPARAPWLRARGNQPIHPAAQNEELKSLLQTSLKLFTEHEKHAENLVSDGLTEHPGGRSAGLLCSFVWFSLAERRASGSRDRNRQAGVWTRARGAACERGKQIQADPAGMRSARQWIGGDPVRLLCDRRRAEAAWRSVVLGMEPSNRPDGLVDMSRKERQRDVRFDHGLAPLYC
jgi:hypothetical protein